MEFITKEYKRCDVVSANGRIDSYSAPQLEETFTKIIEKGRHNLVLDASEITFVSSAGWWALIRIQKTCKAKALSPGELILVKLDPKIKDSMNLVGISEFFKVVDDLTTAVAEF